MTEATDKAVSSILKTLTDSDTAALTVPESQTTEQCGCTHPHLAHSKDIHTHSSVT